MYYMWSVIVRIVCVGRYVSVLPWLVCMYLQYMYWPVPWSRHPHNFTWSRHPHNFHLKSASPQFPADAASHHQLKIPLPASLPPAAFRARRSFGNSQAESQQSFETFRLNLINLAFPVLFYLAFHLCLFVYQHLIHKDWEILVVRAWLSLPCCPKYLTVGKCTLLPAR